MVERLVSTSPVPLYAANASFVGPLPAREDFASWEGFLANRPPREEEGGGRDGGRHVAAGTLSKDARGVREARVARAGGGPDARLAGAETGARAGQSVGSEADAPSDSAAAIPVGPEVPDLFGMSLRLAVQTLREAGFEPSVEGTGIVVEQTPA